MNDEKHSDNRVPIIIFSLGFISIKRICVLFFIHLYFISYPDNNVFVKIPSEGL